MGIYSTVEISWVYNRVVEAMSSFIPQQGHEHTFAM